MALPVSRIVNVVINLSPVAAARRSFNILCIAGDSSVVNGKERLRTFGSYDEVVAAFGVNAPEAKAAQAYYAQVPQPTNLIIGRWLRTASAAMNIGGIISASNQILSKWTVISAGVLSITIDGVVKNLTALDFTAVTNLNGVATVITTALSTSGTCTWDGSKFTITSATTGAGVKASGTITFGGNPSAADTITLNGIAITFVAAGATGNQVNIGASKEATLANLQAFLNATVNASLTVADYATSLAVMTVTYKVIGTGGNAYTMTKSSAGITLSAATLTGGLVASSVGYATTGIAAQLALTNGTNISLVDGYAAETPVECAAALANKSTAWYALMFQASVQPTDDQSLDVSSFIEALDIKRIYGVTITNGNVLSALVTNDLASLQMAAGYNRSLCQYSQNVYAVASLFGRMLTVNFEGNNTTITLMFKQEPIIVAEDLTTEEANVLQSKNCNVFVEYVNDTAIIQYGKMSGGAYIDEVHGLDWLADAFANNIYNLLYTSPTKIPQTDAGQNQLLNAGQGALDEGVTNGLIAPGIWDSSQEFGTLQQGDYLKAGYYLYSEPISLQSQADRATRNAPPIQAAVKLGGAIQGVDALISVNR